MGGKKVVFLQLETNLDDYAPVHSFARTLALFDARRNVEDSRSGEEGQG
jgi:hypothetical protein